MNPTGTSPPEWVPLDTDWPALVVIAICALVVLVVWRQRTPRR